MAVSLYHTVSNQISIIIEYYKGITGSQDKSVHKVAILN